MFRKRKKDDGTAGSKPAGGVLAGDGETRATGNGSRTGTGTGIDEDFVATEVDDETTAGSAEGEGLADDAMDALNVPPIGPIEDMVGDVNLERNAEEIAQLKAEVRENYDKYLRTLADLENVKKRAVKERSDILKYAGENLARDVVDVLDDLDRALAAETVGTLEDFLKGVALIRDRFVTILDQHSIRPQTSLGKEFNPLEQQALATVPTTDHPPGIVIQEFKKAYLFKDKLLRPGQVVVSSKPADAKEE